MNLSLNEFKEQFNNHTRDWDWEIQGFIDQKGAVYPIDSDTKVISTVFERLSSPVLRTIALDNGYIVNTANQTTYPDFTLSKIDNDGKVTHRIAIDVKTTYFENKRNMVFTLGSYNSFIRNNEKNILFPYNTYHEHWVLGFIYSRNNAFQEYDLSNIPSVGEIKCPYDLKEIFIRDKISIVGLRAGSGNTTNIGSIKLKNHADFQNVEGPFKMFTNGYGAFNLYWSKYELYKRVISKSEDLFNHPDFQKFK